MQTEVEAKFLDVDFVALRKKLHQAKATLDQSMRLMRRVIFDYPDLQLEKDEAFLRVRDEGHKVTMTYKRFDGRHIHSAKEVEIVVDDYDKAVELLKASGFMVKSRQESKRETWHLGDCEIVLDEWPWLKPYIEIEGPNENRIKEVAVQLGFDWRDALFGSVTRAYRREYAIPEEMTIANIEVIAFDAPMPQWLADLQRM
jgi:adenylate cyclase class 2